MPIARLAVLAALLLSGCSDFAPFASLDLRLAVAPDTLLPLDSGVVRITVYNSSRSVVSLDSIGCGISYEIRPASAGAPVRSLCRPVDPRRYVEESIRPRGRVQLAPGDSLTVERPWRARDWSGAWLPAGRYDLRPALVTTDYTRTGDDSRPVTVSPWAPVRLVHSVGEAGAIDLTVAGRTVVRGLLPGTISPFVPVAAGPQPAELRRSDDAASLDRFTVMLAPGLSRVLAIRRVAGARELLDVTDDSTLTAAKDETLLRVIHLAETAPSIEVRFTPPGGAATETEMSPFPYGAMSPYQRSRAGAWRLTAVSLATGDTLLSTAPLLIAGGVVRTVILVDAPGGGIWATLVE